MGIFDLAKGAIVSGMHKNDATMWNDLVFFELASGKVTISQVKYEESDKVFKTNSIGTVDIPVGSMNRLTAANVSDNLQWLAVSSKTRGAIWDLNSGERKMHCERISWRHRRRTMERRSATFRNTTIRITVWFT